MKRIIIIILFIAGIVGASIAYYQFNREHGSNADRKSDFKLSAQELYMSFAEDESKANEIYLGKLIEVEGKVIHSEAISDTETNLILEVEGEMFGISCQIANDEIASLDLSDKIVKIKGECSGYLNDVVLIRCVLVN